MTTDAATKFKPGDRVIVTNFRPARDGSTIGPNLIGYYGKVTRIGELEFTLIYVSLVGCLPDAPDRKYLGVNIKESPFPFWPDELEHAD